MMKKFVRVEKEEKTAIVTIDNPPLNVMSQTVVQQLEETYEELSNCLLYTSPSPRDS